MATGSPSRIMTNKGVAQMVVRDGDIEASVVCECVADECCVR